MIDQFINWLVNNNLIDIYLISIGLLLVLFVSFMACILKDMIYNYFNIKE